VSPSPALQRRLRESRYLKDVESFARVLDGLGAPPDQRRTLELSKVEKLWPVFIDCVRQHEESAARWPADQRDAVVRRVAELRDATSETRVIWFGLVNSQPVGIEVPARPLLEAALDYLVSRAGDLMMATTDATGGLCIEFNHLPDGDEYEITSWGALSV
jgi:hypothetical protein